MKSSIKVQRVTIYIPEEYCVKIKAKLKIEGYTTMNDYILSAIREYMKPKPTPSRTLQPNPWVDTKPTSSLLKICSVCKLPKDPSILQLIEYTADGDKISGLMCPDCFDTLPSDLKLNYHPL